MSIPQTITGDFHVDLKALLPRLRIYALSLTRDRDRADDLVQDAVVKALAGQRSFQPGTNFPAWLFRIQRNEFISGLRRQRPTVPLDDVIANTLSHAPAQESGLIMREFTKAFRPPGRLPARGAAARGARRLVLPADCRAVGRVGRYRQEPHLARPDGAEADAHRRGVRRGRRGLERGPCTGGRRLPPSPPRLRPDGCRPARRAALGRCAFDRWLHKQLHELYDSIASEPLPDDLVALIDCDAARRKALRAGVDD